MTLERVTHHCRTILLLCLVPILGAGVACEGQRETTEQPPATPTAAALIRMEGRAALSGREVHSGIHVFLGGTSHSVFTDSRGGYAFDGLKQGEYELIAEKEGYGEIIRAIDITEDASSLITVPTMTLSPLPAATQPATQAIAAATPTPAPPAPAPSPAPAPPARGNRTITGQVLVLDAQGRMTIDFPAIRVSIDELNLSSPLLPDGSFVFTQLPARELVVSAQGEGYRLEAPARVDLRNTTRANVALRMQAVPPSATVETGDVLGTIVIPEGVEAPKAVRVALAGTQFSGVTDEAGLFEFNDVPTGTYTLVVEADKFEAMRLPNVEIAAGDAVDLGELLLETEVNPPRVVETTPRDGARRVLIQARTPFLFASAKRWIGGA